MLPQFKENVNAPGIDKHLNILRLLKHIQDPRFNQGTEIPRFQKNAYVPGIKAAFDLSKILSSIEIRYEIYTFGNSGRLKTPVRTPLFNCLEFHFLNS